MSGHRKAAVLLAWVLCALGALPLKSAPPPDTREPAAPQSSAPGADSSAPAPLPYDTEYPRMGYAGEAVSNPVAALQRRLHQGEVRLQFRPPRGYLDSVLAALAIDPSSQTLVYSKTSLQAEAIDAATPRAIYFNEDTYVTWIPDTSLIEIAAMDDAKGPVFYILVNRTGVPPHLERQMGACLQCHDTFALMGGGVPRFLVLSSPVGINGDTLTGRPGVETTDETPLTQRWGGWFVTGQAGPLRHQGNILVRNPAELADPAKGRHWNIDSVDGLLDVSPYLTNKSDIVALLVLEHQVYIKDLMTRASYKSSRILGQLGAAAPAPGSWAELPAAAQKAMRPMWEGVARALLFVKAAKIDSPIRGSSGFAAWFQGRGPHDSRGRSLRQLDLNTRLFRFPLSYIVYSSAFDHLPGYAQDYLYRRIAEVMKGRDPSEDFAHLSAEDRQAILEILTATKPAFRLFASG